MFITHTVAMLGANSSILRLIQELRAGYDIEPVVLMPQVHPNYANRNLLKTCKEYHIECYSFRFYWFKEHRNWKAYLKCISNLLWYPRILWKMRGKKYDIIHSNGSVISLGALISRVKRTPHVWHLRELGKLGLNLQPLFGSSYEKWVYGHGDIFIAISKSVKDYYSCIIPEKKIRMIYNGVLPPYEQFISVHNNEIIQFCMVGLLSDQKNQIESLIAADILVNRWNVTRFHLSFIGFEEVEYTKKLRTFILEKGLSDYVTFMGECKDVSAQLCHMDVGLMLSSFEAFGRVTVEYMMHGLAVIASDSGANHEIIEDGFSGVIYRLSDCDILAKKMKIFIDNPELVQQYAQRGRARALQLFTSERNTCQVYEVYSQVAPNAFSLRRDVVT